jgi:sugar lactone lactonase YvrE
MPLDRRLRDALSAPNIGIEPTSIDRDLHVVVQRGRRRRRNRRVVGGVAVVALVIGAVAVAPRALDALRSIEDPRPARPDRQGVPGVITTVVGTGAAASGGDGGPASEAAVRYPFDIVVDEAGNLYVLDASRRIRRVDTSGRITTVAGRPAAGSAATDLTEANALKLGRTNALAIDAEGNLYVGGDSNHFTVNKISPSGEVTRIAGTGQAGDSGDGGPAIEAELGWVYDLAVDGAGNIYIVDHDNHRIRMVDTDGVITTIAGTGQPGYSGDGGLAIDARLHGPWGVTVDEVGNVYFTTKPGVVRRIDRDGVITTVAGTGPFGYRGDGGPATLALLNAPEHVEVDQDGRLYIEDTGNHCIRMVELDGTITTIVGTCTEPGYSGDGGPARSARLWEPSGMTLTPDGVLYIADSGNNRVRRVIL